MRRATKRPATTAGSSSGGTAGRATSAQCSTSALAPEDDEVRSEERARFQRYVDAELAWRARLDGGSAR